jgi:hypothetical protein
VHEDERQRPEARRKGRHESGGEDGSGVHGQ